MGELSIDYKMDGHLYNLATYKRLFRLTRDQEVIHVGFNNGDVLNDIIGNLCSFILDVEHKKSYRSISFWDDELTKKTNIYASIRHIIDGEEKRYEGKFDYISGEMKGGYASTSLIKQYECFVENVTMKELLEREPKKPTMTITELKDHLNAQLREESEDN